MPAATETPPATPANVATSQTGGTAPAPAAKAAPSSAPAPVAAPAATPTPAAQAAAKRFAAPQEPAAEAATPAATTARTTPPGDAAAAAEAKTSTTGSTTGETPAADWKLAVPQGIEALPELVTAVESMAKTNGFSQKQAEVLLAHEVTQAKARAAAQQAEADAIGNSWHDASMAHPEIGGPHAAMSERAINQSLLAFATPAERKAIAESPFINNPIFRAILFRASKAIPQEGGLPPQSGNPPPPALTPQERIYGRR